MLAFGVVHFARNIIKKAVKKMRLIDADALTDSLDNLCDTVCQYSKAQRSVMCGACPLGGAFDVVEDAPTVEPIKVGDVCKECWRDGGNVIEVVRCKDCKHAEIRKLFGLDIPFCKAENNVEQAKRPSHYCGYGEKRDEGQS